MYLEWSADIADLAIRYKDREGVCVVGVDVAGDELAPMDSRHIEAFKVLAHNYVHVLYLPLLMMTLNEICH